MDIIIDHSKEKIHQALGLKEDHVDEMATIVTDHFINKSDNGPGHGKASVSIQAIIEVLKRKIFNSEGPIQEYEASLAYLGYLVGCEVATQKNRYQRIRESNPLVEMLKREMGLGLDMKVKRGKDMVFKCDSPEEAELFQTVIQSMSTNQFGKAMGALIKLKDIKEGKGA